MFRITSNHGFHITFKNGVTVSVQFGYGNYCEGRHNIDVAENKNALASSKDAEVAIWDINGEWIQYPGESDVVIPNVGPDKLTEILRFAQNY